MREGKEARPKLTNILLSPNESHELGEKKHTKLYYDLEEFIKEKLIDFWFWGNTHYCTLFDKADKTPFIGSSIGHGGHPIYKFDVELQNVNNQDHLKQNMPLPAPILVNLHPKFPEHTGISLIKDNSPIEVAQISKLLAESRIELITS